MLTLLLLVERCLQMISITQNKSKKMNKWLRTAIALVFWFGVWFAVAAIINKELLVPSPVVVFGRILKLFVKKEFYLKTGVSLLRVLGGFLGGTLAGTLLAVLASISEIADAIITPFVRIIRSTPVTSFIILVMLFISYTLVPVFIAALLVTPILYMNLREGINETDKALLEVAEVYRFGTKKTVRFVYLPSVKPYFVSGAVTSLGLAWKAGIAAETLSLPKNAIGAEIYYSKLYLETPDLFAWTVVVVVFSLIFEKLFEILVKNKKKKEAAKDED